MLEGNLQLPGFIDENSTDIVGIPGTLFPKKEIRVLLSVCETLS
jgi:hypothetical protein